MPYSFEPSGIEWIDEEIGRRINLDGVSDLVDELIDATSDDEVDEILDILSDEPTAEEAEEWKRKFWGLLKWLYIALALVAAAGALTPEDWTAVQVLLLFQLGYLDRFAQEVASGAISKPEARRRMRMYVNSARAGFWVVLDRELKEAGYTQERWDAIGDRNTCSPCLDADLMGWQPIGTFAQPGTGFVLVDPATECSGLSMCRCRKEYK